MSIPKVYIAGAITSDPNYFEKFERCEKMIARFGVEVVNPCKLNHRPDATYEQIMRTDISAMLLCDSVYFMKDWRLSKGAMQEMKICLEFRIPFIIEGLDIVSCVLKRPNISNWAVAKNGHLVENVKI